MRTELYVNNIRVDLTDEINASLTFQISDIRQPDKRQGSFSKTIQLPGSPTINNLFTNIFDLNLDIQTSGVINFVPDFNPNLKASAVLLIEGVEQFRGFIKLQSIVRQQNLLNEIMYNVNLFGDVASIFGVIADKKLTDLDLSAYNHTYNKATQKTTWTASINGSGYVYPMINYGNIPLNSFGVNDFYPAIYLKQYIDSIVLASGYSYTSTFFNSSFFKHLIVPYAGQMMTITPAQQQARLFDANTSAITSGTTFTTPIVFNAETLDPSSQYNTGTGNFVATESGYYAFYTSGVVTFDAVSSVTIAYPFAQSFVPYLYVNSTSYPIGTTTWTTNPVAGTYSSGSVLARCSFTGWSQEILLNAGDVVNIVYIRYFSGWTGTIGMSLSAGARFLNRVTGTKIIDGGAVDMQSALPVDIRQADLLMWVIRAFNLFVETDKNDPSNMIIDTYDAFYGTGSTRDWSNMLDVSKPVTITPMGALDARRYRIKYADDTDFWNKTYTDKWKESYGEKNIDIVNDFLKNVNLNEVGFAPTPCIGSSATDRIIPEIYQGGSSGLQQQMRSKLRMLYWTGSKATVNSWSYTSVLSGTSTETTYPYCGHVDDPINPSIDLSFGVPREIYWVNPYGNTVYTSNNLYNQYHKKYIGEITDVNSKIITASFRLQPLDIFKISFRDKIYIDGQYYRLNKIMDYNPNAEDVTICELLKIKDGSPFVAVSKTLTFTYGEMIDANNPAPQSGGNIGVGDLLSTSLNTSAGTNNFISRTSSGTNISGNQLRVGNNTTNISIFNSSGVTVMDGLSNVNVIGTNDLVVSESNVTYVNGVRQTGTTNSYSVSTSQTISIPGTYYTTGTITLTLNNTSIKANDKFVFIKTDAPTFTLTISGGGLNINGSGSLAITAQYTITNIIYNATQYYKY